MNSPAWLAEFQARFGAAIRTPLDRETGSLRAVTSAYDDVVAEVRDARNATASERVAVYNRQYWFRLFSAMQASFPLVARLRGHWLFNEDVARFLTDHPPRGWDLDRVPDGFEATYDGAIGEAANIDAAWRRVFDAPLSTPWTPGEAASLPEAKLALSPSVAIIEESWPLVELRRTLDDDGERPIPLPTRLERARSWAIVNREDGIGWLELEPREAELYALLCEHDVMRALGTLEALCEADERSSLPSKTQAWLARSMRLGFWISRR